MPNCFKCGQEITFDKTILSKSGKQIPLWVDKQNTHSHDDSGQPIRSPLPSQQLGGGGQLPQQQPIATKIPPLQQQPINTPSLETHLLNQLSQKIEELQKQLNELKYFTEQQIHVFLTAHLGETLEVSKNSNLMLDAIVAHFKLTEPKKASELYNEDKSEGAE